MKEAQLIDGMRARLAVREQGAVSLRGEQKTQSRISEVPKKNTTRGWKCASTHAARFRHSSLFSFPQPCHAVGTLDLHLLMFFSSSLFKCFLSEERGSQVRGSAVGQTSLPGAHQKFGEKFQTTSDVFLPAKKFSFPFRSAFVQVHVIFIL